MKDKMKSEPVTFDKEDEYVVDSRPLCQGMPFVLTDAAHPRLILKNGSHFMVLDQEARIPACNTLGFGYYNYDTRYLSEWNFTVDGSELSLLSADVKRGYAGSFLYTNPQTNSLSQQNLMLQRQIVLSDVVSERVVIENYSASEITVDFCIKYQSDFADMFEVRGVNRSERGKRMLPRKDKQGKRLFLAYRGLDERLLETMIEFRGSAPDSIVDGEARYKLTLAPRTPWYLQIFMYTRTDGDMPFRARPEIDFATLLDDADKRFALWRSNGSQIMTEDEIVNFSIERGLRDLYILRQQTPKGIGIAAGIPWYSAPFGRDSAITGMQMLPYRPDLARECIELLGEYQGTKVDEFRAERPGKIMHELRIGEMARLGAIPHTPYYGTVDATALWCMLVARYLRWTGDMKFAMNIWPKLELALTWLDSASEKTGYISYIRESPEGLENQGWKDSGNSIGHANGELAKPPISLCEVQAYLYSARLAIAEIATHLKKHELAERLHAQAAKLKRDFKRDFWMPEHEFPALALDGEGNQVQVFSSNAGHCIWAGILDGEMAQRVADRMLAPDMDSGWGLRTLSKQASYYNPMSYHNGSVWPHDNAIILEGFRKIGRIRDAHYLLSAMAAVAQHQRDFRLPELVCGFDRTNWGSPIDYPVSCSPQAWAAGSIFQMLSACVNFLPDAHRKILRIEEPCLPEWLEKVTFHNLKVGDAELDIAFNAVNGHTSCQILRKNGDLKVIVEN